MTRPPTDMRELTLTELEALSPAADTAEVPFQMTEEAFRGFYDRTSRPLWAYLSRVTGDRQLADDLVQETYYRFLRASRPYENEAHRRNSLFHIATNLVRDARRRPATVSLGEAAEQMPATAGADHGAATAARTDVQRALAQLRPRDRMALWLAYAQGESHRDIAATIGVKTASVKLLLFRARRKLAASLRGDGQ